MYNMYLYGAGGHSIVVAEIVEDNGMPVKGVFDDNTAKKVWNGLLPIWGGIKATNTKQAFSALDEPLIITVGNNVMRAEIAQLLDIAYGTAIHKSSIVSPSASVGAGTVVLHGAIIQAAAIVGRHVLVNTGASIDHDNVIGDYAHISPQAALCGHVTVGEGTHIGAGAVVIPKINIGKWCLVGAGAVVIRDIPDFSIVVGNPAKLLMEKTNEYRSKHPFYLPASL